MHAPSSAGLPHGARSGRAQARAQAATTLHAVTAPQADAAEHGASTALSPTFGGGRRSAGAAEHRTVGAYPAADHDGNFWHIVAGGLIGGVSSGAIEAAVQYAREGRISDWGRIGAASAGGAVSGAIAAANPAAGLVSFHGINGVSGIVGGLTERLIGSGGKDAGTLTDVAIDGAVSVVTGGRGRSASNVKKAAPRAPAPPQRKAHDFSSEAAWKRDYSASRAGGDVMCPCFAAGTLVETAEGPRAIESVRVGDLVLSRDEATGETGFQPVTEVFITPDKEVLELTVTDDQGASETVLATPGHPFWVEGQGWVTAAELRVGEALITAEQGLATLSAALSRGGRRTVYNLEVEGWHTYFVGEAGAWVHNACRCGGGATTPVTSGPSRAPRQGTANSIHEQVSSAGEVRSRTFYDQNGHPFSRQDFDHSHGGMQPHEHLREFDAGGQPIRRETVRPVPPGYDTTPTPP